MNFTKMMMAAAIAAGLVGAVQADIASANVVGYNTKSMNAGGFKMAGNSFVMVSTNGMRLSSLVPAGYEANQDLIDAEATSGDFTIQTLTKFGKSDKVYSWERTYNTGTSAWNDDGHWKVFGGATIVAGDTNDVVFAPGAGLWISAPDNSEADPDAAYTFTDAGQVLTANVMWVLNVGGFTACANPYPAGILLTSLIPAGYEANQDLIDAEATSGDFTIQTLTKFGKSDKVYSWERTYDTGTSAWNDDGHWKVFGGASITPGDANDPTFAAGAGIWVSAPDYAGDDGAVYSFTASCPVTL